jgi:hypothetical protein
MNGDISEPGAFASEAAFIVTRIVKSGYVTLLQNQIRLMCGWTNLEQLLIPLKKYFMSPDFPEVMQNVPLVIGG